MGNRQFAFFIVSMLIFSSIVYADFIGDFTTKFFDTVWNIRLFIARNIDRANTEMGLQLTLGAFISILPIIALTFVALVWGIWHWKLLILAIIISVFLWYFVVPTMFPALRV